MQILCVVNQAECFRRGFDAPRSTIKIEVDPAKLPEDIREFLADHLHDGYKASSEIELRSPDLLGLMEAVLTFKEFKEHRKGEEWHTGLLDDWTKGAGKAGSAGRLARAKELTEAQRQKRSTSMDQANDEMADRNSPMTKILAGPKDSI